jgi:transcriptional regulator with XRE-family HTH domain
MNYTEKELQQLNLLALNIKNKRKELNISQEELAGLSGVDRTYISFLERSKRNPSILNLQKVCQGLNTSLSNLLKDV